MVVTAKKRSTMIMPIANLRQPIATFKGHPRCNIIYSFSLIYGLLSGLNSLLRKFFFLFLRKLWVIQVNYITLEMSHISLTLPFLSCSFSHRCCACAYIYISIPVYFYSTMWCANQGWKGEKGNNNVELWLITCIETLRTFWISPRQKVGKLS